MEEDSRSDVIFDPEEKQVFRAAEFEGPLDLLLYQIQKSEINIYDIPIAEITEQFLQWIEEHKDSGLKNLADFYKMAADLLYIKSRMLLPIEVEFDEEYEDPRRELVDRLLEYQKFKKYTDLLTGAAVGDNFHVPRKENLFALPFDDADLFKDVTVQALADTFRKILEKKNPSKLFNVFEEVSVNEKVTLILELLEEKGETCISEVIVDFRNPLHIICSFLAILRMAKDKLIVFRQDEPDGEIFIVARPQDWESSLADEYDREYDEMVDNDLSDPDDFSILRGDAGERAGEEMEDDEDSPDGGKSYEFVGDEENLLDED